MKTPRASDQSRDDPAVLKASPAGAAARYRAWGYDSFRRVWAATLLFSLGNWTERIVVGFFVFDLSDSVFLTAASFAVRQAPGLFTAPIAGAIVDRWPRARVLGATAVYKTMVLGGLAALAMLDAPPLWPVFVISALGGIGQSFEIPATQGLVTDSVPRSVRMNAVAVQSIGARGIGAIGAMLSGTAIDELGTPAALGIGASAFLLAGAATLLIRVPRREQATQPAIADGFARRAGVGLLVDSFRDLRLLFSMPAVRLLLVVAVVVEMFGFAFGALLPSLAREVLDAGGTGLGALTMMASFGSLGGVIGLSLLGDFPHKGRLLVLIILGYGTFLVVFASSAIFVLSMILILGVGMGAGAFDAMQWTLLQAHVPENMRGRAIGGWVFAIGFGWVGHIGLGALGELVGVQWAIGGAGAIVLVTGIVLTRTAGRLKSEPPLAEPAAAG